MKKDSLFKLLLRLVSVFFLLKGVFNFGDLLFRIGSRFPVVVIFLLLLFFLPFCTTAQFPYNESFMGTSAVGVKYGGNTGAFLTAGLNLDNNIKDPENEGYLRLTSNKQYQTGYVYADAIFLGTYGLDIEFEYFTYGGTGDADGICFFLFDATANPFTIGGFGGSLGYAQYIKDDKNLSGVSKGYLGIGIDEYGNFATNSDSRQGGYSSIKTSSVTIRGAGNGNAATLENYKWLETVQTKTLEPAEDQFSIRGGIRGALAGAEGYRKVFIKLIPIVGGPGLKVNLSIQHGNTVTPIFTDYEYKTAVPAAGLRYGIAASTGSLTNYHEIRGLKIAVDPAKLAVPLAVDDVTEVCQGKDAEYPILTNDNSPNDVNRLNERVDLNPLTEDFETTFTTDQGTFTFDESVKLLRFKPVHGLSDNASVKYRYMDYFGAISNVATAKFNIILPKIIKSPQNVTVCEGNPASLTVEAIAGSDISYQWQYYNEKSGSFENLTDVNGVSGATSSTIHFENARLANSGKYSVNIKSSTSACGEVTSDVAVLTVNPIATLNPIANQEVCSGSSTAAVNFDFSGGNTYHWTNDNIEIGLPSSGDTNIASYVPVNTTDQSIIAHFTIVPTSSTGCPGAPVSFTITVFPAVVKPEITAVETAFCKGNGVVIKSSSKVGNQWYKNGDLIEDATEDFYEVYSEGNYTVRYTDENGCGEMSDVQRIISYPRPATPSITGDLKFCKGSSVTLTSTPGLTYRWYLNTKIINGSDGQPYDAQTYTTSVAGNYGVATLSENGCFSILSDIHTLTENTLPQIPTITSSSSSFCKGGSLILSSSLEDKYQWYKDGIAVPGAVNQLYIVTEPAKYSVVVFNTHGCSSTSATQEITFTASPTLVLTSAIRTDAQELCLNETIIPIVYHVTNATGAKVDILPLGLHGI